MGDRPRTALLWFRSDLRLHDHPALTAGAREYERLLPVFVLDDRLLRGRFSSSARTWFMLQCLAELEHDLRARGSALAIRHGDPASELPALARQIGADAVLWTSDVGPFARARDRAVTDALREAGVQARPHGGGYIVDPSRPRTKQGDPFRVFSPFFKHWLGLQRRDVLAVPHGLPAPPPRVRTGSVPSDLGRLGLRAGGVVDEPIAAPGERAARKALTSWLREPIGHYADRQNGMARLGTSQLSPYLRWGCLSPRECEARAREHGGPGSGAWVRQLCWREFYAHVLLMWPDNLHQEFQERYRSLEWDDPEPHLSAWQRGETGYPAVDAGMRQLAPHRLDAQSSPPDRGLIPHEGPPHRLAAR